MAEMMRFIGITAVIDSVLVLIAWFLIYMRHSVAELASPILLYFLRYLIYTFVFLILIAVAMFSLEGRAQTTLVMLADVVLWISLVYMALLALGGKSSLLRNGLIGLLLVLGFSRTIFLQLNSILGWPFGALGSGLSGPNSIEWLLVNMDAILMYAVWVPVAFVFLGTAFRSADSAVRARSVMFAVGLLFITYSWVARLQLGSRSLALISICSLVGFAQVISGVSYRKSKIPEQAQTTAAL